MTEDFTGEQGFTFKAGAASGGVERWEVGLDRVGFSRHRHDRYAIGVTLTGVQRFFYRGTHHECLPTQWQVLHPDEIHDGMPGDGGGFRYRIFYLDPSAVLAASGRTTLPFVDGPVLDGASIPASAVELLRLLDAPIGEMSEAELVADLTDLLLANARMRPPAPSGIDLAGVRRVAELLRDRPEHPHRASELEQVAGMNRWTLARQFRAVLGTSPTRFRTLRRLERARTLLRAGVGIADAAQACGFSDQAHLTRAFRSAFGVTPGRWRTALADR
ncbi:AraC family transcriptional regulator [Glycomyces halotolerans]